MTPLTAISPIDGRYHSKTKQLSQYFSEEALIKYRVKVEVEYFIALCELPLPQLKDVDHSVFSDLRAIYENFTTIDAQAVKEIEKTLHQISKDGGGIVSKAVAVAGRTVWGFGNAKPTQRRPMTGKR